VQDIGIFSNYIAYLGIITLI